MKFAETLLKCGKMTDFGENEMQKNTKHMALDGTG